MTFLERRTRQYRVTHIPTGIVTVLYGVNADGHQATVAAQAGWRWPADCDVHRVKRGQEIPLPFDEIPLVLRPRVA